MGKEMKRYSYRIYPYEKYSCAFNRIIGMKEDTEGEWIKWKDHKNYVLKVGEDYQKLITELKDEIMNTPLTPLCNCLSEAEQPTGLKLKDHVYYTIWICPAHGYKKI